MELNKLGDPRAAAPTAGASPGEAVLYRLAGRSLEAAAAADSAAFDGQIAAAIDRLLDATDGKSLAALFDHAPSPAVHRHLWRILAQRARTARDAQATLGVHLFAIPLVIVAGPAGAAGTRVIAPGTLANASALAALLREHDALAGNQAFAFADALVSADAIDLDRLPGLLREARLDDVAAGVPPLSLAPSPVAVEGGEAAHLRFLVGSALAAGHVDLTSSRDTGRWGMPLARALIGQLATPGITVIALPRPAQPLPVAVAQGRAAHREIAASLFVSHALREFRAGVGEPVAVLSAHRAADVPGGGELRLSLSSPFSPRDAYGFRCPLHAGEQVRDVATMLVDLLRDCRVTDIRVIAGVHPDRDTLTGAPLLYKPGTIPPAAQSVVH